MPHSPAALKSLHSLLVENHNARQPLLAGAMLYRGTRLPDQTQGSFSQNEMHGSLLVQVAATYTHNWTTTEPGFIGGYPVTRDTRFYADFGLEQALNGKDVKSHSVQEVEAALAPLVAKLAEATSPKEAERITELIEKTIHHKFYEAGVPTRTIDGEANRPKELFAYHGTPSIYTRAEALPNLERLTPENESIAKNAVYARYRNEVQQELQGLELTPGFPGRQGYDNARKITQAEFGREICISYGELPLNEFLDKVAKHPVSARQQHLGEMTKAMAEACASRDPASQGKGLKVAQAISQLDPHQSGYNDMLTASRSAISTPTATHNTPTAKSRTSVRDFGM